MTLPQIQKLSEKVNDLAKILDYAKETPLNPAVICEALDSLIEEYNLTKPAPHIDDPEEIKKSSPGEKECRRLGEKFKQDSVCLFFFKRDKGNQFFSYETWGRSFKDKAQINQFGQAIFNSTVKVTAAKVF